VSALASYRQLLRNSALTRLLAGEFVSSIGSWMYLVALVVIVYQASGNAFLLGVVGAARVLPYVFLSIPAGMVADRFDRRYVLLVSDIARGIIMVILAWLVAVDGPVWMIVALAILATCFATLFYPAIGALIPALVKDETEFGPANSAWSTLDGLAFVIGPAIGGLLIAASGLALAFLINAITFGVIAVVLWTLPPAKPKPVAAPAEAGVAAPDIANAAAADLSPFQTGLAEAVIDSAPASAAAELTGAAATSRHDHGGVPHEHAHEHIEPGTPTPRAIRRPVAGVMLVDMMGSFVFGGLSILTVVLATTVYHSGEAATGYLNAAIGIGAVIGAVFSGVLVLRRRLSGPLGLGAVVMGVAVAALGMTVNLGPALIAMTLASLGSLILEVTYTTIFQRVVPDALRGRASGLMVTTSTLAQASGSFLMPVLAGVVGAEPVLIVSGVGVIAGSFAGIGLVGSAATREPTHFEEHLQRAKRLPVFAGLPPARLENTLGRLKPVAMTAGQVIIRQGDPADRFYIIADGTVSVTQQETPSEEPRFLRQLGEDAVFGEIGLLTSAPRTATVTAESDGLLLALEGPVFLELVSAGPAFASRLLDLYQGNAVPTAEAEIGG